MSRDIPMELRRASGNSANAAVYQLDSHFIEFGNKSYRLKSRIHDGVVPSAELRMDGRLKVSYKISGSTSSTQYCEEIKVKKRRCPPSPPKLNMTPSPPSPPLLDLRVVNKCYQFVQALEGRKLAPMTGSMLEAQLLISRVDSSRAIETSCDGYYGDPQLDILPLPLEGVTEASWAQIRSDAFK
jgi:hypothetical protein